MHPKVSETLEILIVQGNGLLDILILIVHVGLLIILLLVGVVFKIELGVFHVGGISVVLHSSSDVFPVVVRTLSVQPLEVDIVLVSWFLSCISNLRRLGSNLLKRHLSCCVSVVDLQSQQGLRKVEIIILLVFLDQVLLGDFLPLQRVG